MIGKGRSVARASRASKHERNDGDQHQHQYVVGEIEHVDREEIADAVGVGADARDQVAGPLAAEELQRKPLHVAVGSVAQVGRDSLAHPGHDVGASPGQEPSQHGGPDKREQRTTRRRLNDDAARWFSAGFSTLLINDLVK